MGLVGLDMTTLDWSKKYSVFLRNTLIITVGQYYLVGLLGTNQNIQCNGKNQKLT